jgi:KipI family sensor histidine kinase inhibitor
MQRPIVVPFGDSGVFIQLDGVPGPESSRLVQAVARQVERSMNGVPGWGRPVPAATSILVPVDPVLPGAIVAVEHIRTALETWTRPDAPWPPNGPAALEVEEVIEIPVRYGGSEGPDLDLVARGSGLSPHEVITTHSKPVYTVLFLGFAPGFAYLGPLDRALVLPRRAEPRAHVPAGSVAIAGPQTAVYPTASPGGWLILGRTSMRIWDPAAEPPARIRAGMHVRFVPE